MVESVMERIHTGRWLIPLAPNQQPEPQPEPERLPAPPTIKEKTKPDITITWLPDTKRK